VEQVWGRGAELQEKTPEARRGFKTNRDKTVIERGESRRQKTNAAMVALAFKRKSKNPKTELKRGG